MRTIIAGGRDITDCSLVEKAVADCGWRPSVVLCGMARGVDSLGLRWAKANGVPVEKYPALWHVHGNAAGPIRNREMAESAEALILIWDGESPGSRNMLQEATARGLQVYDWRTVPSLFSGNAGE